MHAEPREPQINEVSPRWHWPEASQHPVQVDGVHLGAGLQDVTVASATIDTTSRYLIVITDRLIKELRRTSNGRDVERTRRHVGGRS